MVLKDRFVDAGIELNFHHRVGELEDDDAVVEASLGSLPMVARTEIGGAD